MNKKIILYVVLVLASIGVIFGASILYNKLSDEYDFVADNSVNESKQTDRDEVSEDSENIDEAEDSDEMNETDETDESQSESNTIKAVDFTVYDTDGNEVKLSSKYGKPIVMNFWATWCHPCKSELPAFEEMYNKYKDDVHFMMINVTDGESQTRQMVDDFVSDNGYTFPVYYDETLMASIIYGASSIPLTVFVYPDGTIYGGRTGAMQKAELEYYINDVLRSEDIEDNT